MKKLLLLLMSCAILLTPIACTTVSDAVPKTKVKQLVKVPARNISLVELAYLKVVSEAISKGVVTEPEQVANLMNTYAETYKDVGFWSVFARKKAIVLFEYESPKGLEAKRVAVVYDPEAGSFNAEFDELKASTDPALVIAVGDAQASIYKAEGEKWGTILENGGSFLESLGKAGAAIGTGGASDVVEDVVNE